MKEKKKKNRFIKILNYVLIFSLPVMLLTVNIKTNTINSSLATKTLATSFISKVEEVAANEISEEKSVEKLNDILKPSQVQEKNVTVEEVKTEDEYKAMKEEMADSVTIPIGKEIAPDEISTDAIETFYGNMSGYGPWQDENGGWHLYRTATEWDLRNGNIYYQDPTYGKLRIVASDNKTVEKYSVIRCTLEDSSVINVIVLDNGDKNIGRGRKFEFDLAYESASAARNSTLTNIKFEILRKGK